VGEGAIAVRSRAGAFINAGARKPSHRGVRRAPGDLLHPVVLLFQVGLEIVAQAVIQRQLPRDLPAILRVKAEVVIAELGAIQRTELELIREAQHEAGVIEAGAVGYVQGLSVLPWVGRLGVGENEETVGAPIAYVGVSLNGGFSAVFEIMVSAHPGQAGVTRALLFIETRLKRAPYTVYIAKKGRGPTRDCGGDASPSARRQGCGTAQIEYAGKKGSRRNSRAGRANFSSKERGMVGSYWWR
jgi:hypothetical protein